jgi:hypothetical protein
MKPGKLSLIYIVSLGILLGASIIVLSQGQEVKANVSWDPRKYTLDTTVPQPWNAEIWLTGGHKREEINTTTILLEGIYEPVADPYPKPHGPRLVVPFDGNHVLAALTAKLPHLTPGKYRIGLEITGLLLDGTPFRGVGYIHLIIPEEFEP